MTEKLARLCRKLCYSFQDPHHLQQALTHRSASHVNNERLEFLGDAILSFVMANVLYQQFSQQSEGKLSRLRAHLVKGETLAQIAVQINLGDHLNLGQGELKSGGFRRESILADALEAVFAAIYLDGGISAAETVILHLFAAHLQDNRLQDNLKDHKTQLQEYLQAHQYPLPQYVLTDIEGKDHQQIFHVSCQVPGLPQIAHAARDTRRKAEQEAARELLAAMIK